MIRKLYVKIESVHGKACYLSILEQTHRCCRFFKKNERQFSSVFSPLGYEEQLCSCSSPFYNSFRHMLYVRGSNLWHDHDSVEIPIGSLASVLYVVLEYNKLYSKNTLVLDDVVEGLELLDEGVV